jgi:hypothetical protein
MSGPQTNCASSSQINYYSSCRIIEELAETRILAKQLKVLDLNRNDLPGVMYFVSLFGLMVPGHHAVPPFRCLS